MAHRGTFARHWTGTNIDQAQMRVRKLIRLTTSHAVESSTQAPRHPRLDDVEMPLRNRIFIAIKSDEYQ